MSAKPRRRVTRSAIAGALLVGLLTLPVCSATPPPRARNLLLISLDTVRRDHLPTYGYPRATAPTLDHFARSSRVFDNSYSQQVNTTPSHASMLTGVYPHTHGILTNRQLLPEQQVTLAQILRREGFRTGGFVSSVVLSAKLSALDRGFEVYDDEFEYRRSGVETTARALAWLRGLGREGRFFLFLHLYDAHGPYRPADGYRGRFASESPGPTLETVPGYQQLFDSNGHLIRNLNEYVDRYDDQIRYLDDRVAELLGAVDLTETLVVILSDHGETLGERFHKLDHGTQLFDEQIRIPLIVRVPGVGPARADALVETVDLLPSVLELLGTGIPRDRPVEGFSFAPLFDGAPAQRELTFASGRTHNARHADRGYRLDPRQHTKSVRSNEWKLISYPGYGSHYYELYHLPQDPGETKNLSEYYPMAHDALVRALGDWESRGSDDPAAEAHLDERTIEHLRRLGYTE